MIDNNIPDKRKENKGTHIIISKMVEDQAQTLKDLEESSVMIKSVLCNENMTDVNNYLPKM